MKPLNEMTAQEIVDHFNLSPLEREGGMWGLISRTSYGNSIVYLMTKENFSRLHRLLEDELWISIAGSPFELTTIDTEFKQQVLHHDQQPFHFVPANTWFAARPTGEWSLAVLSLAPAFSGMEMASAQVVHELSRQFPTFESAIIELSHG